jgi:hypothetical protein
MRISEILTAAITMAGPLFFMWSVFYGLWYQICTRFHRIYKLDYDEVYAHGRQVTFLELENLTWVLVVTAFFVVAVVSETDSTTAIASIVGCLVTHSAWIGRIIWRFFIDFKRYALAKQ